MQHVRRRCAAVVAALMIAAGGVVGAQGAAEAVVPAPDPMAIGQLPGGVTTVLATDTDIAGTQVKLRPYKADLPPAVKSQRWIFQDAGSGRYQIRHVSSNLCLAEAAAQDGAIVTIVACSILRPLPSRSPQVWTAVKDTIATGFRIKNTSDSRCLDILDEGSELVPLMWTCDSYDTQVWRPKTGPVECEERLITAVCVASTQPVFGVMGTWRQQPMTLARSGSTDPYAANTLYNMVSWNPLTSTGTDPGYDHVEMGWRGSWSAGSTTGHQAYWLEDGIVNSQVVEEYHGIVEADSTLADGSTHTWMSLGTSSGQWDVLYDFNPVGTTRLATGGRTRSLEYGLLPQYDADTSLVTPFEDRVQILDGNGVWRRPRLGEAAQQPNNICGQPNPVSTQPNSPPYCYTASVVGRASTTTGGPPEVDRFVVGKPAVGSLTATATTGPITTGPASTYNGVDQHALADCIAKDASACLTTVPGLATCVQARLVCNIRGDAPRPKGIPITAGNARERARTTIIGPKANAQSVTLNAANARQRYGLPLAGLTAAETVHVVTGRDTVRSLRGSSKRSYTGYTLVYAAQGGELVYACLGQACLLKEAQ